MIEFEKRTDREREMLQALLDYQKEASEKEDGGGGMANLMAEIMGGKLSKYKDLILNEAKGGLPIRSDLLRQFAIYGNDDPTEGTGIPGFLIEKKPIKGLLTAMALTAMSTGKEGNQVLMEFLPQMMQGKLFCYCITEPGAGTNTNNISTVAVDEGDHYRLNGQKTFISAADSAHYMVVIARVEIDGKKEAIGTFMMETDIKGISMTPLDIAALGDRQFTIHFDDVILPKEALVGAKNATGGGSGISESVLYTLNLERIGASLGGFKIAQESFEKALKKAKEKPAFGPVPASLPEVKQKLAKAKLKIELTNLALKKATYSFDRKEDSKLVGMYSNMAKYLATMVAYESGGLALSIYGVDGLNKDGDDIGSLYYLARLTRGIPINNEMVLNFLGENLLGLPKSYRT